MSESIQILFGLTGGLALFLYGMNAMSESLQKAAGERMKKILGFLTINPLMGALAGALVTAVLQSSSATTVMVIGFVSAGLMGLPQAISVIFGANIGTTITAQLIAFNISDYIYPLIFIGFLINFLSRQEKVKNIGMVIFSFGLLFEGIEIMSSVMQPLASSPIFIEWMKKVKDIPVLGVIVGAVMTMVVQSSSATIAVLQSFASTPGPDGVSSIIGLTGAIPIILGDNIGTTITAVLASIGQNKDAKRTTVAHCTFNITGSIVFCFLIQPYARFIQWISPKGPEVEVISRQIANAHTIFNVIMTLIWLPLIPLMVKWVHLVIKGGDDKNTHLFQDDKIFSQPSAALVMVKQEIIVCKEQLMDAVRRISSLLTLKPRNKAEEKSIDELLEETSHLLHEMTSGISRMFSLGSLDKKQADLASDYLSVADNMERMSDRCIEITNYLRDIRHENKSLSTDAARELQTCLSAVNDLYKVAMNMLHDQNSDEIHQIGDEKSALRKALRHFSKNHLSRIQSGTCDPGLTRIYSDILYAIDRMGDNCSAIAEEALDES